ncbi:MAG: cell wall-binding repeat-containing protein [Coriobacteriia bacterium]|nr:cell wall-binding repeat-containing protein [Coriobacteriia bacterium]
MCSATAGLKGVFISVTLTVALVLASVAFAWAPNGSVYRVNVAYDGGLANGEGALGLAVSEDGRYVVFASSASNIVEGDANGRYDIFWRDMVAQHTELVNVTVTGGFATEGAINYVDMTPDGRYVVFGSSDTQLLPNDTNMSFDVFVRDMVSEETTLVATTSEGAQANWGSFDGSLSDDGRFVAFTTEAYNLFPDDENWRQDVIVKDLRSGETTCVSMAYDGGNGNGHSFYPTMSGDGSKVAFVSYATNLVPDDVSAEANLFIRDLDTGEIERVDATTSGGESSTGVDFNYCDMDYTGRFVAFMSRQTDIVDVEVGPDSQVYLRDTESDETTVVARALDGGPPDGQCYYPSMSSDGRWVSFVGYATNLVEDDTNGWTDVFLRDMHSDTIERINYNEDGEQLDLPASDQVLSGDGSAVVFNSTATNIVEPYATGSIGHIYLRIFAGANTPPIASADAYETPYGVPLVVGAGQGVLANDEDADGDPLSAVLGTDAEHGELVLSADGSFTYAPDAGFWGEDTFTYHATDGQDESGDALVTISVGLPPVIPVAGDNRFQTAVEASQIAFPDGAETVVIATGMNWPDALGGTSLAGALDAPILLVSTTAVPEEVMTEIRRLEAQRAVIIGGTAAVGVGVENQLNAELGSTNVDRIDGENRYRTADAIALEVIGILGDGYEGMAFVATGGNFPDALAAAPLAAAQKWPLFLADPAAGLSAQTVAAMADVTDALILGGTAVVSSAVEAQLEAQLSGTVDRLDGPDRYATAVEVATYAVDEVGHTWDRAGITTGANFPDALAGGVLQGKAGSVMLLTPSTALNPSTRAALVANKAEIKTLTFFGGLNAVTQIVRDAVFDALE